MRTLYSNIKQIVQFERDTEEKKIVKGKMMRDLPVLNHAYIITCNGIIEEIGLMNDFIDQQFDQQYDCSHQTILPTWIDSHTHLVYAKTREHEFVDRIHGLSYEQIAQRGGGILNSALRMQEISEDELFSISLTRLHHAIKQGTGAIEIKSGYGLNTAAELKMLRVIKRLREISPIPIKASFLAAHTYPLAYRENHQAYIDIIIHDMLPIVAHEQLADYMDVFCEKGFFSPAETDQLLEAAAKYGLKPKIHANQLYNSGGVQIGVKHGAISVDHLETMDDEEINCLLSSQTIPCLLPGAAFFLAMHYQPARKMIDAGLPVAIASDYNPGSCPTSNMNFMIALACTQMKMTPEEAIHATTINAAAALELESSLGTIKVGKKANFIITKPIDSIAQLPYFYGDILIDKVIIGNQIW